MPYQRKSPTQAQLPLGRGRGFYKDWDGVSCDSSPLPRQCDECRKASPVFSWISLDSTTCFSCGALGFVEVSTPVCPPFVCPSQLSHRSAATFLDFVLTPQCTGERVTMPSLPCAASNSLNSPPICVIMLTTGLLHRPCLHIMWHAALSIISSRVPCKGKGPQEKIIQSQ